MDEAKIQVQNNANLTLPTVPSASPQTVSISVSHQQNNTIHLSWEPPPPDTHNGILQGYQVTDISSCDAIKIWCFKAVRWEKQTYMHWIIIVYVVKIPN